MAVKCYPLHMTQPISSQQLWMPELGLHKTLPKVSHGQERNSLVPALPC